MIDPDSVLTLVRSFHNPDDGAATKSRELISTLLEGSPHPFSRRQFAPGHITCTGLVLSPDRKRLLLVHHRRLDRWLLPGGHIEPRDAHVWDAARREVIEETGAVLARNGAPRLISLDVHGIPARRSEPYHLHHDLVFHFRALHEDFTASEEVRDIVWCEPRNFTRYRLPESIRRAYFRVVT